MMKTKNRSKMVTLNPSPVLSWYLIQRKDMPSKSKYLFRFREAAVQAYSKKEAIDKIEQRIDLHGAWVFNRKDLVAKKIKVSDLKALKFPCIE